MNVLDREQLLTFDEAAEYLGVSESTLRRMIASREIPAIRIGGRPGGLIRIRVAALQQMTRRWESR